MHRSLTSKVPIILGTVPLVSFQPPAPYTDVPQDISSAPTQPVSPVSPVNGVGGAMGWNLNDAGTNQLYPNMRKRLIFRFCFDGNSMIFVFLAPPTFAEGDYKATGIMDKNDSKHTISNSDDFAPRYPTYAFGPSAPSA